MGKLRLAATAAALTVAAFAAPAFAQVSSAADCNYEGGEVFNVQGATAVSYTHLTLPTIYSV